MLKIPYGVSNFESLITEGYLYVDKTRFVRQIEEMTKFLFFVRPRGFGKSLFISVLENYYDEKHIRVILFSLLGLTDFYLCHSEREVEHGFIDLFLTRNARFPELPFEWLIELKYLKEGERGQLETVKDEARGQLQKYASSDEIRQRFRGEAIRQAALIFIGKGDVEIVM